MGVPSLATAIVKMTKEERGDFYESMPEDEKQAFDYGWHLWARAEQMAPPGDWPVWLIMAGRGFGKTRAGAEWVRQIAEGDGSARFALVGASYAEVRTLMVEGESGLLSIAPPATRPRWEPSLKRLSWPNGAEAHLYSAQEPEGLRGPEHSHAWCDEIAKWMNNAGQAEAAWDNLKMGLRLGRDPRITATTTPRPVALVRRLINDRKVVVSRGATLDNAANLPDAFLSVMALDYGGTRLGRQELDGELIEELEGALWTRAMIEGCRVSTDAVRVERSRDTASSRSLDCARDERGNGSARIAADARRSGSRIKSGMTDRASRSLDFARDERDIGFSRIVIGVDPPASSSGDACGIIVAGLGADGKAYVLADCSVEKASPETWARRVADAAARFEADRVVAEANQGGAMVKSVLQAADISLPVKLVHASRGKVARAEPVAALYEHGRVHHVGAFERLEDELCGLLIGGGYEGPGRSPDRADALVWALTELMLGRRRVPRVW